MAAASVPGLGAAEANKSAFGIQKAGIAQKRIVNRSVRSYWRGSFGRKGTTGIEKVAVSQITGQYKDE